mmetsp:Transcript_12302/g.24978  ORF Transcript_12302/g.24978 Transcript_12302/m.24978 type:complete len:203 (-) Transcript_12302:558-1166(-)
MTFFFRSYPPQQVARPHNKTTAVSGIDASNERGREFFSKHAPNLWLDHGFPPNRASPNACDDDQILVRTSRVVRSSRPAIAAICYQQRVGRHLLKHHPHRRFRHGNRVRMQIHDALLPPTPVAQHSPRYRVSIHTTHHVLRLVGGAERGEQRVERHGVWLRTTEPSLGPCCCCLGSKRRCCNRAAAAAALFVSPTTVAVLSL